MGVGAFSPPYGTGLQFAVRSTVAHTTTSLANNASEQSTITMAKGFRLLKIQTDRAARVRLYDRTAKQTLDINRKSGSNPGADAGVIFDYTTVTGTLSGDCSPQVFGSSMETVPVTTIPITTTNLSGATATVTVTLTYMATE